MNSAFLLPCLPLGAAVAVAPVVTISGQVLILTRAFLLVRNRRSLQITPAASGKQMRPPPPPPPFRFSDAEEGFRLSFPLGADGGRPSGFSCREKEQVLFE